MRTSIGIHKVNEECVQCQCYCLEKWIEHGLKKRLFLVVFGLFVYLFPVDFRISFAALMWKMMFFQWNSSANR